MVEEARVTQAREEILARIRAVAPVPAPALQRTYRRAGDLAADRRVMLFAQRVSDYRATVRHVEPAGVADAAAAACRERGAARIGVPTGLPPALRPSGVQIVEDDVLDVRELDALDGVVTGCTVAIAETGTIVLAAGATEGRRALTLVPDLHICIVRHDQIVELVPEALRLLEPLVRSDRRPLTFVSGPSATSDIELDRVEGVHGPRTLVVLITREEPA
jgi:L-lactate dehydrogenase complex protein LldG